jgi:hypothetical protein
MAFIVNTSGNSVVSCTVSGLTISSCSTPFTGGTFNQPFAIAISGSTAYITNIGTAGAGSNSIVACTISGGVVVSCGTPFIHMAIYDSRGIAIYNSNAYILSQGDSGDVVVCSISSPGVLSGCVVSTPTGRVFSTPRGIAIA